jgi:hypothetical protein
MQAGEPPLHEKGASPNTVPHARPPGASNVSSKSAAAGQPLA